MRVIDVLEALAIAERHLPNQFAIKCSSNLVRVSYDESCAVLDEIKFDIKRFGPSAFALVLI